MPTDYFLVSTALFIEKKVETANRVSFINSSCFLLDLVSTFRPLIIMRFTARNNAPNYISFRLR